MEKVKANRKPYDPGQPAGIEVLNFTEGIFLVKPFQKASGKQIDGDYQVDLSEGSCTCPHFLHRIAPAIEAGEPATECKHCEFARAESRKIALHIAAQLSATNLRRQILRTDLRPEIHEALLEENWSRLTRPGSLTLRSILDTLNHAELTTA